jgi:hypothetical protein
MLIHNGKSKRKDSEPAEDMADFIAINPCEKEMMLQEDHQSYERNYIIKYISLILTVLEEE